MKKNTNLVLVTGAGGFVGSYMVRQLLLNDYDVHIISREEQIPSRLKDIGEKLTRYVGDIAEETATIDLVKHIAPSYILHFAAYGTRPGQVDSKRLFDTNVFGVLHLLKAAENIPLRLFIAAGSSSEYGMKDTPMKEGDILEPLDEYGITKAAATHLCMKYAVRNTVPVSVFRLFSPYGDDEDNSRFVPYIINSALGNKPLFLSRPTNVRDFMYIEDVWKAYLPAMRHPEKVRGQVVNITQGNETTLRNVVEQVLRLTNSKSKVEWNIQNRKRFVKEPIHWQGDIRKAKKLLGWQPENTLSSGLQKTIEWFRNHIL